MPQTPLNLNLKNPVTGGLTPGSTDNNTATPSQIFGQGWATKLDVTATGVIKVGAGRLVRVLVVVAGSGTLTFNDAATTGAAATANEFYTASAPAAGSILLFDWPVTAGIVLSAIPAGAQLSISYS